MSHVRELELDHFLDGLFCDHPFSPGPVEDSLVVLAGGADRSVIAALSPFYLTLSIYYFIPMTQRAPSMLSIQ
jgi:hypothetical protein